MTIPSRPLSRLAVFAAWEPELERFRTLPPLEADMTFLAAGIGPVDMALGTARSISSGALDLAILVGTCGGGGGLAIGDVVVGTSVRLADGTTAEGRSAMPYAQDAITLDVVAPFVTAGAKEAAITNTLGITTDDALAKTLGSDVEHLEAYGFARACTLAKVPCAVVLGVTNAIGSRGRDEWRANHVAMSARAAEVAHEGLALWISLRNPTRARSPA